LALDERPDPRYLLTMTRTSKAERERRRGILEAATALSRNGEHDLARVMFELVGHSYTSTAELCS
jgi:hypothetical protein